MHVYINGYGAPKDPLNDENLRHYLNKVLISLNFIDRKEIHIYLAGGYTNRADLSEAAAMKIFLESDKTIAPLSKNIKLYLLDKTTTARENMLAFRKAVGDVPALIFCERSREPSMKFFAKKLFKTGIVLGIQFDENSMRLKHQIFQRTIKLWLEKLAWENETFDKIREYFRARHLAKARQEAKK